MRMNNFFNYAVIQPLHVFLEVLVSCSNIPKFRAKQLETKLNILFESLELHRYKVMAMAGLLDVVLDGVIFVSKNFSIVWIDVMTPCLAVLEIIRSFRGSEFFDLCLRDLTASGYCLHWK